MEIKFDAGDGKALTGAVGEFTEECENTTDDPATETALRLIDERRSELIALIDAKTDEFKKKVAEEKVTSEVTVTVSGKIRFRCVPDRKFFGESILSRLRLPK